MHEEERIRCEDPRLHLEQEQTGSGKGSHQEANDERHQQETEVQKVTDTYVKKVDDALAQKEKEITQV